ncbi:MAG TPA: hypothetical protein VN622_02530 [Clostridia bacterium]|nr:hypothetical protein [Clostridia bacterium]
MNIELESMAIEMPEVDGHPNRRAFRGVLTLVDAASDKAPSGARGHRVVLTGKAAERALPSLLGMALDYAPELDRHDARRKVGIITSAVIERESKTRAAPARRGESPALRAAAERTPGQKLLVSGYLFARDFPEIVGEIRASGQSRLGMSYEIADARVADTNAPVWLITECTFTGAAVLRRDKAAYGRTWIALTADGGRQTS